MSAFFDYFSFSVRVTGDLSDCVQTLSAYLATITSDLGQDGPGMYFYSQTMRFPGALLAFGGDYQKNTVYISITGQGCSYSSLDDLRMLVNQARRFGVVVPKRFDLAVNVPLFAAYYDILNDLSSLLLSSRVTKMKMVEEHKLYQGMVSDRVSGTLYFGSRQSPRMTRVYMKYLTDELGQTEPVTRIEIECKEGWAVRVLELFCPDSGSEVFGPSYILAALSRDYIDVEHFVSISDDIGHEVVARITYPVRARARSRAAWLLSMAGCIDDVRQVYGMQIIRDLVLNGWMARGFRGTRPLPRPQTPSSNTGVQLVLEDLDTINQKLSESAPSDYFFS